MALTKETLKAKAPFFLSRFQELETPLERSKTRLDKIEDAKTIAAIDGVIAAMNQDHPDYEQWKNYVAALGKLGHGQPITSEEKALVDSLS